MECTQRHHICNNFVIYILCLLCSEERARKFWILVERSICFPYFAHKNYEILWCDQKTHTAYTKPNIIKNIYLFGLSKFSLYVSAKIKHFTSQPIEKYFCYILQLLYFPDGESLARLEY